MSNWAGSVSGIIIIIMICLFGIAAFKIIFGEDVKNTYREITAFGRSNPKHHKVYRRKRGN